MAGSGSGSGSGDLDLVPDPELFIHYSDSQDTGEIILDQADPIIIRPDYGERSGIILLTAIILIQQSRSSYVYLHLIAITTCSRCSWRVLTRGVALHNNCAKPRTELDKTSRLESWNIYITTIRKCDAHNVHFEHFEWWSWFYSIEEFMRIAIYCNNKFSQ